MTADLSAKEKMIVLLESLSVTNTQLFEKADPQTQCRSRAGKMCAAYSISYHPHDIHRRETPYKTCWLLEILQSIADFSKSTTPVIVGRGWEENWLDHLNVDIEGNDLKPKIVMPETASCPLYFTNYDYQTLVAWLRACIKNEDE